jgi:hypothetical protein
MTVSNVTCRVAAAGSGEASQAIPFVFPVAASSDLVVKTRVIATGVEATLTETTDYTVALTDSGASGGTVTLVDVLASTSQIHVIRKTSETQTLDLVEGGVFSANNIEAAYDKLARSAADHEDGLSRALRLPDTDPVVDTTLPSSVDRASKVLAFDSDGKPIAIDSAMFGTHTDLAAEAITGYITVVDSGGTSRKLAVVS